MTMPYDVIEVRQEDPRRLYVRFRDGVTGTLRFMPSFFRGVFTPLKNPEFFAQVNCKQGFVTWPGELDLAPDAMHDEIQRRGEWVLE